MKTPPIPASFFGIVLGLVGLGDCWRVANHAWALPKAVGEITMITGFVVWVVLILLYLAKWAWHRDEALAEWRHPVQSCFIGLTGVATILAGIAIAPYAHTFATALFIIGTVVQLAYGIRFTSNFWMGERDEKTLSPALYLPTVAGNFVSAFGAGYFGYPELGVLFLGAGVLSWLALESIITHRLATVSALPLPLRPAMGIMLAPPVVGCIGYLFVTGGLDGPPPDLAALALFGYGLLMFLILIRLLPWVMKQPFTASYWAFSFGITAIAFDAIVFVIRGAHGPMESLAVALFVVANLALIAIITGTVRLLVTRSLMPPPLVPVALPSDENTHAPA
ncbi:MAG: dicarboxylate transporter/tellurite-resistance protein TehA [Actinobacteria bacterium]|nr:dicarboxylate transporter/tellurite-resistance protein TehA [Actinomycetota bacterium]